MWGFIPHDGAKNMQHMQRFVYDRVREYERKDRQKN